MVNAEGSGYSDIPNKQAIINNIIKLAESEVRKGNNSISEERITKISRLANNLNTTESIKKEGISTKRERIISDDKTSELKDIEKEKYRFSPLFYKYKVKGRISPTPVNIEKSVSYKGGIKRIEQVIIEILENAANILDNLHIFSQLPMFPKSLLKVLKQTNKLWVILLIFLIRKTASQLLNVIKKEKKVNLELAILNQGANSKLLVSKEEENPKNDLFRKYQKLLKDLKFDKMMLLLELIGNILDIAFNIIELYDLPAPQWFMSSLNFASLGMSIYRMNKDDEYIDDDISHDLI